MDIPRDEVRRQLREADAANRAAMRPWPDALRRIFTPTQPDIPVDAKAQILGVPTPGRRQVMKLGGLTFVGAAVLAACGDDDDIAETGTTLPATTTTGGGTTADTDLVLLRSASSLEVLAVETYDAAVASGLVTTAAIADAAVLFRDQHDEHARQLQSATEDLGGEPYTDPNPFLKENVVDPGLAGLADENDVVAFALDLETVAAQTYAFAAGVLSVPELRQAIMAIGGVEARHATILRSVLAQPPVPDAFLPTTDRAPDEALVS